ncbi:hypothetical protein C0995_007848, partial [Termitomyces sp. Mi166
HQPRNKGKSKVKAVEEDKDKEGEAAQNLRKELENFMVPTKFNNKLLASLLPPPMEFYERNVGLLQGVKISGGRKGDITLVSPATQALVLEKNGSVHGGKSFPQAAGFGVDSELMDAKQTFKLTELVDSDSGEEEEERVHVIKKIKHEHVEEPVGMRERKEIIELEDLEETVAPKTPMAGPSCQTVKPMVLVSSVPKPILKPIVALASPPAVKGGFVFKDPFMVRQFKLVSTEESGALIINQVTEVAVTQETLRDEDTSDKDSNDNDDNAAMDVDSADETK